jgi:hypothetical protein
MVLWEVGLPPTQGGKRYVQVLSGREARTAFVLTGRADEFFSEPLRFGKQDLLCRFRHGNDYRLLLDVTRSEVVNRDAAS